MRSTNCSDVWDDEGVKLLKVKQKTSFPLQFQIANLMTRRTVEETFNQELDRLISLVSGIQKCD